MDTKNMETPENKVKKSIIEVSVKYKDHADDKKFSTANHIVFANSASECEELIAEEYSHAHSYKIATYKDKESYSDVFYDPNQSFCGKMYKVSVDVEMLDEKGNTARTKDKLLISAQHIIEAITFAATIYDSVDHEITTVDCVKLNSVIGSK